MYWIKRCANQLHERIEKTTVGACRAIWKLWTINPGNISQSVIQEERYDLVQFYIEQIKLVRDTLERKISWWDRFDAEHFFWHGIQAMDGDTEKHQCQCGETIPSLCLDSFKPCNCDAAVAIPVSDQGMQFLRPCVNLYSVRVLISLQES